jgi:hypothetical protein
MVTGFVTLLDQRRQETPQTILPFLDVILVYTQAVLIL